MNATNSIRVLCQQLGVTPNWSAINKRPPSALALQLVTIAADLSTSVTYGAVQQENIDAVLDAAAPPTLAEAYAGLAIQMAETRDAAVDRGRALLGDLIEAGPVR